MAHQVVRSSHAIGKPRKGEVRFGCDIRAVVKDALIDIAHDQRRTLRAVGEDALTDYARLHWQREEPVLS